MKTIKQVDAQLICALYWVEMNCSTQSSSCWERTSWLKPQKLQKKHERPTGAGHKHVTDSTHYRWFKNSCKAHRQHMWPFCCWRCSRNHGAHDPLYGCSRLWQHPGISEAVLPSAAPQFPESSPEALVTILSLVPAGFQLRDVLATDAIPKHSHPPRFPGQRMLRFWTLMKVGSRQLWGWVSQSKMRYPPWFFFVLWSIIVGTRKSPFHVVCAWHKKEQRHCAPHPPSSHACRGRNWHKLLHT